MECMEARALKSSFFSELAMKSTNPQAFPDDLWCVTGLPGGDDFSIDEYFDLPNDDNEEDEEEEEEKDSCSLSSLDPIDENIRSNFSPDLAIPVDDVQELELWSHLMDDSGPEATLACPNIILEAHNKNHGFYLGNRVEPGKERGVAFIPSAVPVKTRSKRPRNSGIRAWKSPTNSESSTSSTSSPVSTLLFTHDMGPVFIFGQPPVKKAKRKSSACSGEGGGPAFQRRCSHCQVTKTPQWRAGPNGPKSLCNACGVRFKSGRLYPEYRPACSPTFSSEVHSNSHRKVLEMRRKRGVMTESTPGSSSIIEI